MRYLTGYLNHEEVLEFQALCKKCYNLDLTLEECEDQASRMIMFLESLDRSELNTQSIDNPLGKDNYGRR